MAILPPEMNTLPVPPRILTHEKSSRAFSLVEVALALGVVSVALISLLGLMPIGLSTFRDSMHATVQADVLRMLTSKFQETPFDKLTDSTNMLYFSDESILTDETNGLLGVTYSVSSNTPLLSSGNGYANANLKTVQIHFYTRADRAKAPQKASSTNVIYVPPGIN